MKFVIKSGSTVKLFSGDLKIEALAKFLKENFASWNSNNLTYTDKDGDKITLTTQEDLDALIAMNPSSPYSKLEITEEKTQEKEENLKVSQPVLLTNPSENVPEEKKKKRGREVSHLQKAQIKKP